MDRLAFLTLIAAAVYPVRHSDAQWKQILGADRYEILRENGTEPAFSSPLIAEHRTGVYRCAGCDLELFTSAMKYDSGDGWPSFWTVLPHATLTRADYDLPGEERTEVHCARCGGHLGHIFDDGPAPTHLRYCIDGLALRFIPKA
ncbi:MAG TPA: peptide-methionine (R)-S-oxide reductase MsrB [Candidatus Acidoferrales bacterium]|nr:peptide-methionine (R)-S-oxide reductase MsrB [Candidatus Acidoferrales bacterium]